MDETEAQTIRAQWHRAQAMEAVERARLNLLHGKDKLARGELEHAFYLLNRGINEAVLLAKGMPLPELPEWDSSDWAQKMQQVAKVAKCMDCGRTDHDNDWAQDDDGDWHCDNCWPSSSYNPDCIPRCYGCSNDANPDNSDNDGDVYCDDCWSTSEYNPNNGRCDNCNETCSVDYMHGDNNGNNYCDEGCCPVCVYYTNSNAPEIVFLDDHDAREADLNANRDLVLATNNAWAINETLSYWHETYRPDGDSVRWDHYLDLAYREQETGEQAVWGAHDAIRNEAHLLNITYDNWHRYTPEQSEEQSDWTWYLNEAHYLNRQHDRDREEARERGRQWRVMYYGPGAANWDSVLTRAYAFNNLDTYEDWYRKAPFPNHWYEDPEWVAPYQPDQPYQFS